MSDPASKMTITDQIATRAEAARIAEHQAALESLRQFGEPLAPPDPAIVIDMRRQAMATIYDREWEEYWDEATALLLASGERLRAARGALAIHVDDGEMGGDG